MAGVLVTLGEKALAEHQTILRSFIEIKESLEKSVNYSVQPYFSLSKFKRVNEEDTNFIDDKQFFICIVGTLIYKNSIDLEALNFLKIDLLDNIPEKLTQFMDGHFALFVINKNKNTMDIITDHAGIIQIYVYQANNSLIISSSSMAISRNQPVTINEQGVAQFLRNSFICGSKTIYNEIELLEPATVFSYSMEERPKLKAKKQYWKSPIDVDETIQFEEVALQLSQRLNKNLGVFENKKIVCDLTAGYDSRMILSSILSRNQKNLNFETFVYGPGNSKEVELVKNYAENLSIINHHLQLPRNWKDEFYHFSEKALNITDGEDNAFQYAPILYAQYFKKQNFEVSVNGLGGELYRDFWWLQEFGCARKPANLARLIHSRILQYEYDYSIFSGHWKNLIEGIDQILLNNFQQTIADMDLRNSYNTLQIDNIYFREKIRKWAGRLISSSNQIIRTIAPLCFKHNLSLAMSFDPNFKKKAKLVRAVIQYNNKNLGNLPMLDGVPAILFNYRNFYKLLPRYFDFYRRGIRKISQKLFRNTILLDKTLKYDESKYWKAIFENQELQQILKLEIKRKQNFFDINKFSDFRDKISFPGFKYYPELGNIFTLKLRMKQDRIFN